MLFLRHRFCGQIRNLPFDTAPAKLFLFRDAHPLSRTSHLSIGRCGDVGMTAASGRGVRPDAADRGLQLWSAKVLMLSVGGEGSISQGNRPAGGRTISQCCRADIVWHPDSESTQRPQKLLVEPPEAFNGEATFGPNLESTLRVGRQVDLKFCSKFHSRLRCGARLAPCSL